MIRPEGRGRTGEIGAGFDECGPAARRSVTTKSRFWGSYVGGKETSGRRRSNAVGGMDERPSLSGLSRSFGRGVWRQTRAAGEMRIR